MWVRVPPSAQKLKPANWVEISVDGVARTHSPLCLRATLRVPPSAQSLRSI